MSDFRQIPIAKCVELANNPQVMSAKEMAALKASMRRDGFLAPVLVRPLGSKFEVVSGNHRVNAARDLGMTSVPAVVVDITDEAVKRLAVNMNTVHGDPTAMLLAPFLARLDDDVLATVHLDDDLLADVLRLDDEIAASLAQMQAPPKVNNNSPTSPTPNCVCAKCGKKHVRGDNKSKDEAAQSKPNLQVVPDAD